MRAWEVEYEKLFETALKIENTKIEIKRIKTQLDDVSTNLSSISGYGSINASINLIAAEVEKEEKNVCRLGEILKEISNTYKNTESEISKNCPETTRMNLKVNKSNSNVQETNFEDILKETFGFDEMTANAMEKIYKKLQEQYGDDAEHIFFALMAAFSYGIEERDITNWGTEESDLLNGILWNITGNIPTTLSGYDYYKQFGLTEAEYEHMKNEINMQHALCDVDAKSVEEMRKYIEECLGDEKSNDIKNMLLNEMDTKYGITYNDLPEALKDEMAKKYLSYTNKVDFSHMSATTATILNEAGIKQYADLGGLYNGVYSADNNSGYAGDIYGIPGAAQSIGNADYMADLDAVNIANRIQNGATSIDALNTYYQELSNNETNRAEEFVTNMGDGNKAEGYYVLMREAQQSFDEMEDEGGVTARKEATKNFFTSILLESNILIE